MIIRTGNLWDSVSECSLLLITSNSTLKSNLELTMGRGIALEAKNKYPDMALTFGYAVHKDAIDHTLGKVYGFLPDVYKDEKTGLQFGLFQTKFHWSWHANPLLIMYSASSLWLYAEAMPYKTIFLPYPGIGYGRLSAGEVEPFIKHLPNNVHIWTL